MQRILLLPSDGGWGEGTLLCFIWDYPPNRQSLNDICLWTQINYRDFVRPYSSFWQHPPPNGIDNYGEEIFDSLMKKKNNATTWRSFIWFFKLNSDLIKIQYPPRRSTRSAQMQILSLGTATRSLQWRTSKYDEICICYFLPSPPLLRFCSSRVRLRRQQQHYHQALHFVSQYNRPKAPPSYSEAPLSATSDWRSRCWLLIYSVCTP